MSPAKVTAVISAGFHLLETTRKGTVVERSDKTVTVSMTPSGKYYASVLMELEGDKRAPNTDGKVAEIDLTWT